MIKVRKAYLKDEGKLEEVRKKRHLDFLDILLFDRVSVYRGDLKLYPEVQKAGQTLYSLHAFPR